MVTFGSKLALITIVRQNLHEDETRFVVTGLLTIGGAGVQLVHVTGVCLPCLSGQNKYINIKCSLRLNRHGVGESMVVIQSRRFALFRLMVMLGLAV